MVVFLPLLFTIIIKRVWHALIDVLTYFLEKSLIHIRIKAPYTVSSYVNFATKQRRREKQRFRIWPKKFRYKFSSCTVIKACVSY